MRRTALFLSMLISPVLLTGCAQSIVATADQLCKDWRHQTVSKDDRLTDKTASGLEGSNEARVNWGCAPGQNKAKS